MTPEELLRELRDKRLLLTGPGELWPDLEVTSALQRAVKRHQAYIAFHMQQGSIEVCPSRDAHRRTWWYRNGQWYCGLCQHLLDQGIGKSSD